MFCAAADAQYSTIGEPLRELRTRATTSSVTARVPMSRKLHGSDCVLGKTVVNGLFDELRGLTWGRHARQSPR